MYCIVLFNYHIFDPSNKNNTSYMKTFKILAALILFLTLSATINASVMSPEAVPGVIFEEKNNIVKTVIRNGVYIPVVELPVIEITGKKKSPLTGIVKINGINRLVVTLPEVEISFTNPGVKQVRAFYRNGEIIATINLPVIEIRSDFSYKNLVNSVEINNQLIPIVNLPEINIVSVLPSEILVRAKLNKKVYMPQITLPEIEISSAKYWIFTDVEKEFAFENNELEWIYISLKNCGITMENKIICEVSKSTGIKPGAPWISDFIKIN